MRLNEILSDHGMSYDKNDILAIFARYFTTFGVIDVHEDGSVSVVGDCVSNIHLNKLGRLPIKFRQVSGNFLCAGRNLTTLEGSPRIVKNNVYVDHNKLTSLIGAPVNIGLSFYCHYNPLVSLEGLPEEFYQIELSWNDQLPLLRLIGRPNIDLVHGPEEVNNIIRKYSTSDIPLTKPSRKMILSFQKELIDAGFEGNASW